MRVNGRLYKTLSQKDFAKLNLKMKREYLYFADKDIKIIKEQPFENTSNNKIFQLVDEDYEWNPKEQSLFLTLNISLSNLTGIFGVTGFCYEDAILGLGLVWKPEKSRIKRCKKICEFKSTSDKLEVKIDDIELPNISSNVSFDIIIYISKPGTTGGHCFLANEEGMIIYSEQLWSIIVDGTGSIFPIIEIENEDGPIWTYYCDVIDISEDPFDLEHIRININKKHPCYSMIHHKSPNYSQAYVNEILSTAMAMIILDLRSKQNGNLIDLNEDCYPGSILNVIKYFSDKLGFKINDDYNTLLSSIKMYFDKEISL